MRILNLYAGIGGNRKLWGNDHEIIAVENIEEIAKVYQDIFPNDKVIVADAHQYLLDHFKEFDFIWSSPPCPTHSNIRHCGVQAEQYEAKYPAMELYQEIILMKHFAKGKWVIENVVPYYEPLIGGTLVGRHLFWSNFNISPMGIEDNRSHNDITGCSVIYGFDLNRYDIREKRKLLRNMVDPKLGKHVLECAMGNSKQKSLFNH